MVDLVGTVSVDEYHFTKLKYDSPAPPSRTNLGNLT